MGRRHGLSKGREATWSLCLIRKETEDVKKNRKIPARYTHKPHREALTWVVKGETATGGHVI
jgi:hypothetical protein